LKIIAIGPAPARRVAWKWLAHPEELSLEGLSSQFVAHLHDLASLGVDPAEAGDGVPSDDRLSFGKSLNHGPAAQDRGTAHRSPPFQPPLTTASTHCSVVPSQVGNFRIAGR
jgi:hypothetical protein